MSLKDPITGTTFTGRDVELAIAAFKCVKEEFSIDYVKFASRGKFKNSNSSKVAWHSLKKKLDKIGTGENDPITLVACTTETTKGDKGKKRKAPTTQENTDDLSGPDEDGAKRSPKKCKTKSKEVNRVNSDASSAADEIEEDLKQDVVKENVVDTTRSNNDGEDSIVLAKIE